MKKHQPSRPPGFNPEELYTQVNKQNRGHPSQPLEEVDTGESSRRPLQQPVESVHATFGMETNPQGVVAGPSSISESDVPSQRPVENPYSIPRNTPNLQGVVMPPSPTSRRPPRPQRGVEPYLVVDLFDKDGQGPKKPDENPYEEVNQSYHRSQNPIGLNPVSEGSGYRPQGVVMPPSPTSRRSPRPQRGVEPYLVVDLFDKDGQGPKKPDENPYEEVNQSYHRSQNPIGLNPVSEGSGYRPQGVVMPPSPTSRRPPHPQRGVSPYLVTNLFGDDGQDPPGVGTGPYAVVDLFDKEGQGLKNPEEGLYEEMNPRATTSPSRAASITKALGEHVKVQYGEAEVKHWCKLVYGNSSALDTQLARVLENPTKAEDVLYELLEKPETGGRLAGREVFGVKSPGRREAEEDFGPLCAAFERHVSTVQNLHKDLNRQYAKEHGQRCEPEGQKKDAERRHHHHRRSQGQHSPEREERQQRENSPARGAAAFAL
ncbi:hypothetical protein ABID23_000669 [Bartonella silvatica]|uniref:BepD protein n=1 Tax=Bartonella silvatica TaxID=357760 RepID=A0ABV2HGA8_9HYPH